jgi:hypothetical protein
VDSIGGLSSGVLPGKSPYHGNLPVKGFYYSFPEMVSIENKFGPYNDGGDLSCPGCGQWEILSVWDKGKSKIVLVDIAIEHGVYVCRAMIGVDIVALIMRI